MKYFQASYPKKNSLRKNILNLFDLAVDVDLVVSNVLYSINKKILARLVESRFAGKVIFSGMIDKELESAKLDFEKFGFSVLNIQLENEWFGLLGEKELNF